MMTQFISLILTNVLLLGAPSRVDTSGVIFPELPGWTLSEEQTVYTSENLFDIIDGAADLYLDYEFVDLHIARYRKQPDLEVKVELYKMKTAEDAFGIYSQERFPDYHFIKLGVQGYLEKGTLNFFSGQFYVKISTIKSGDEIQDAVQTIGMKMEVQLHAKNSWPAVLAAFPAEGKELNSEQYIAKNFMGYGFLNGAYTANFGQGSAFKAFIIPMASSEQAAQVLSKYLGAVGSDAGGQVSDGRFRANDPHNGHVEILLKGRFLCGIYGTDRTAETDPILKALGKNISSMK